MRLSGTGKESFDAKRAQFLELEKMKISMVITDQNSLSFISVPTLSLMSSTSFVYYSLFFYQK